MPSRARHLLGHLNFPARDDIVYINPDSDVWAGTLADAFEHAVLHALRHDRDTQIIIRILSVEAASALMGGEGQRLWIDMMAGRRYGERSKERPYLDIYMNLNPRFSFGD